jgi:hypothetical protein
MKSQDINKDLFEVFKICLAHHYSAKRHDLTVKIEDIAKISIVEAETIFEAVLPDLEYHNKTNTGQWQPLHTAPRDMYIDTCGYFEEKGTKKKHYMRHTDYFLSSSQTEWIGAIPDYELRDWRVGTYYATHWMPIPTGVKD